MKPARLHGCVGVACSGGRDSLALLHATARAARGSEIQVWALHVHHGLSDQADLWLQHLQGQVHSWAAQGLPVALLARRVRVLRRGGQSLEAQAREARYAALAQMAREQGIGLVLLAHHRRDQAETFLLQALRGAGVEGLSAMPAHAERDGVLWVRPWLDHPREAIEAYVAAHGLSFVDDDSNADRRFARNRLRLEVWPRLLEAFPQAEVALATAARHVQDAAHITRTRAAHDLAAQGAGVAARAAGFPLAAWQQLDGPRLRQALRAWFSARAGASMPPSLLRRLVAEVPGARSAAWPAPGGTLQLYRGALRYVPSAAPASAPVRAEQLCIRRAGRYRLAGWGGCLEVRRVQQGGVALARLAGLQLRERSGGERFQLAPRAVARSLKKQFQALGVPAWLRGGPLVHDEAGVLLFVPGLGVDARVFASSDEPQVALSWVPDAASPGD